jgi:hypothetical protein
LKLLPPEAIPALRIPSIIISGIIDPMVVLGI